jgi:hypothetical protein
MTLYISDGSSVFGPLTSAELVKYVNSQKLNQETWQVCDHMHIWKPLNQEFARIAAEAVELQPRQNETNINRPVDKDIKGKTDILDPAGAIEKIAEVRSLFNGLWERQNERLVAKIKNCKPDDKTLLSAKELGRIKEKISETVIQFWRKEGTILNWIKELTWGDPSEMSDAFMKFESTNIDEKEKQLEKYLNERGIYDWEGCYCYLKGDQYLYIGESTNSIGKRMLIDHKDKIFWHEGDAVRILIPADKRNTKKMERLLILNYTPTINDSDGHQNSSADEVLDILEQEIDELARP